MQRTPFFSHLVIALALIWGPGGALAQTPPPTEEPAAPPADAPAADEATGADTEATAPAETPPPGDPPSDDPPSDDPPSEAAPADGAGEGPRADEPKSDAEPPAREEDPVSPESEMTYPGDATPDATAGHSDPATAGQTDATGPATDDVDLRLPVQVPVPPPPAAAEPAERPLVPTTDTRDTRSMGLANDLPVLVARTGGFHHRRGWGGLADNLTLRGSVGPALADVSVTFDGIPIAIPTAGRGAAYTDLELIPVTSLGSIATTGGPFAASYSGRVTLESRRMHGADGGILFGERGTRRIGLAGGAQLEGMHALVSLESRYSVMGGRLNEDQLTFYGTAGAKVGKDLELGIGLRHYRDVWDEIGTLAPASFESPLNRGATDGGELNGTGVGVTLAWEPSHHVHLTGAFGYLDDFFLRYETTGDQQRERKDKNRIVNGALHFDFHTDIGVPTEIKAGLDFTYDSGRTVAFGTEGRERRFPIEEITSDYIRAGAEAGVGFELAEGFTLGIDAGMNQHILRRAGPAFNPSAAAEEELVGHGYLFATYEVDGIGGTLRAGHGDKLAGDMLRADGITESSDSLDLTFFATTGTGPWRMDWTFGGYAAAYGGGIFESETEGDETLVTGGELGVEIAHAPSGVRLAGRGGPMIGFGAADSPDGFFDALGDARSVPTAEQIEQSLGREPSPEEIAAEQARFPIAAVGVPSYVAHIGIMRHRDKGFVGEVWLDAYGPYALEPEDNGRRAKAYEDISVKLGYRFEVLTIWLGAENLLDTRGAADRPTPTTVLPRQPRTFYGMLQVHPWR